MRNAVSHGYFAVDLKIVWSTVERSIPELKAQLLQASQEQPQPLAPKEAED
jgi:uncharacterized protein with HEPN domain